MGNESTKGKRTVEEESLVEKAFGIEFSEIQRFATLVDTDTRLVYLCKWRGDVLVAKKVTGRHEIENFILLKTHNRIIRFRGFCRVPRVDAVTQETTTSKSNQYLIFMDYKKEDDLEKLIKKNNRENKNPLPLRSKLQILLDVAYGLNHIHKQGIIYRDLALRNVLVDKEIVDGEIVLRACITDFGWSLPVPFDELVAESSNPTITVSVEHAPWRIMAPECTERVQAKFSFASDVWAFGVLLYTLLEEQRPYHDIDSIEKVKKYVLAKGILHLNSEFWKEDAESHQTLDLLLASCLQFEAAHRTSLDSIISTLEALLVPKSTS